MNFLELQEAVMQDRFGENKRASIKIWLNSRYGRVWAKEPWSFKLVVDTVTLPSGDTTVAKGDLQRVIRVWDASSDRGSSYYGIETVAPADFYTYASRNLTYPQGVTVIGDNIVADSVASTSRTFYVLGERKWTPLVSDADVPLIPTEFHYMLVHGAASIGLRVEGDPTADGFEAEYQAAFEDMRRSYMSALTSPISAYPGWPFGY